MNNNLEKLNREIISLRTELQSAKKELSEKNARLELFEKSEAQIFRFIEQSPLSIEIYDLDGSLRVVNKMWNEIWGIESSEVINKYNILDDRQVDVDKLINAFRKAAAGISTIIEERIFDPSVHGLVGRKKYTKCFVYPIKDLSGDIKNIAFVQEDLTDKKSTEIKLEKRINLNSVISKISSHLNNIVFEDIDKGIQFALQMIGEYANAPRVSVFSFNNDFSLISNIYQWVTDSNEDRINELKNINTEKFEYYFGRIKKFEEIIIETPGDIPSEAVTEKKWTEEHGFWPFLMIPIYNSKILFGCLGVFGEKNKSRKWGSDVMELIRICSELISNLIQKHNAEITSKTSVENFGLFFNKANSMNAILDLNGKFIDLNSKWCETTGYTRDELLEKTNTELTHPDDLEITKMVVSDLLNKRNDFKRFEKRILCKNGTYKWIDLSVTPIKDSAGNILNIIGTATDITEAKKREDVIKSLIKCGSSKTGQPFFDEIALELARSLEADYTMIGELRGFEKKSILTISLSSSGCVLNNIEFNLIGTPCEKTISKGLSSYSKGVAELFPEHKMLAEMNIEAYVGVPLFNSHKEPVGIAIALFKKPIEATTFAESILLLFAERISTELERLRTEENREVVAKALQEKNEELEQIVYVTSHDLRSPLVNVQGFSSELNESVTEIYNLLNEHVLPASIKKRIFEIIEEEIPESLDFIQTSIKKMDSLLSGLLRLSRLGRAAIIKEDLNMDELIDSVIKNFEYQLKGKDIKISIGGLPLCRGDRTQIDQVFSNLLDNAIKYLDSSRPGLISITGESQGTSQIFCVEDNGVGIEKQLQKKIFEIFYRIDPLKSNGLGLGMTLVKKIIERHNGEIWVESEKNKGSKIFVSIPNYEV